MLELEVQCKIVAKHCMKHLHLCILSGRTWLHTACSAVFNMVHIRSGEIFVTNSLMKYCMAHIILTEISWRGAGVCSLLQLEWKCNVLYHTLYMPCQVDSNRSRKIPSYLGDIIGYPYNVSLLILMSLPISANRNNNVLDREYQCSPTIFCQSH